MMNRSSAPFVLLSGIACFGIGVWLRFKAGAFSIFVYDQGGHFQDAGRLSAWISTSHALLALGGGLILLAAAAALFRPSRGN